MNPQITRVVETQETGDQGKTIASIRIEFKIGAHGPFTITLPKAGFTAAAANQHIAEFASHLRALNGIAQA